MKYMLLLLLGLSLMVMGCQTADPPPENAPMTDPFETSIPADTLSADLLVDDIGTVEYQEIEGGFYGIVADDGSQYNPKELDEEFQEDGLRVRFRGYIDEEAMTAQMWGQSLHVMEIMALDVDY